ncbi:Uncharacterized protein M6B38_246310 [Iris pallida]|uniref:Uncharacterized protein n=1 Tax=Iris pallida TaxID=29817 RepID=A0AAX6DGZ6_IRIPA|nr:Uncharacterized protein M6B38_246310 [Iris pallida]
MSPTPEIPNATREMVKVGTTGTVSSLMSQELETVKDSPEPAAAAASTSRKKLQTAPVSVPCGYNPKRSQLRRNTPLDPGSSSSSSSSSNSGSRSPLETQKPKPRRNGHRSPMLNPATEKREDTQKKKGHTHIVEVVDLKCNNPMSSRLKKLGFSKLSESVG